MPEPSTPQEGGAQSEWRVLTFHGSIHMATIAAEDEADACESARKSTYSTVIQRRDVGPWENPTRRRGSGSDRRGEE